MLDQLKSDQNSNNAYKKLNSVKEQLKSIHLRQLFAADPERFNQYSVQFEQVVFDYSKHRVNHDAVQHLIEWAETQNLRSWIGSLFSTQTINYTEQRSYALGLTFAERGPAA